MSSNPIFAKKGSSMRNTLTELPPFHLFLQKLGKAVQHGHHLFAGYRSLFAVDSGTVKGDEDADGILGEIQDQVITGTTLPLEIALLDQLLHSRQIILAIGICLEVGKGVVAHFHFLLNFLQTVIVCNGLRLCLCQAEQIYIGH